MQISANAWYGAAHSRVIAADIGVGRSDSTLALRSDVDVGYADDRDASGLRQVTARAVRTSIGLDYRRFDRYSPFAFASFETNLQQRIARRYGLGVGTKLTLLRKGRNDLSLSLALLEERTRSLAIGRGSIDSKTRWSLRFRYRRQLTANVYASHVTFYQPDVRDVGARFTVDATTSLEVALTSVLSLTSTHRHRYDSEARTRGAESNDDGQLLLGMRASF